MADTYKRLYQGVAGTTAAAAYTVPGSTSAIVKSMRIVNYSGAAATIKLWHGTGGAADANVILPEVSVDAGGFAEFDGTLTMAAADIIYAQAGTVTSITLTIYGLEIT